MRLIRAHCQKLDRAFYDRNTVIVARELLGKYLVHISDGLERIGRIVEDEAYLGPHDLAAHSSKGLTKRTVIGHPFLKEKVRHRRGSGWGQQIKSRRAHRNRWEELPPQIIVRKMTGFPYFHQLLGLVFKDQTLNFRPQTSDFST